MGGAEGGGPDGADDVVAPRLQAVAQAVAVPRRRGASWLPGSKETQS